MRSPGPGHFAAADEAASGAMPWGAREGGSSDGAGQVRQAAKARRGNHKAGSLTIEAILGPHSPPTTQNGWLPPGPTSQIPSERANERRRALQEALRMAQLEVLALVKAPTAAAIAFSLTNPRDVPRDVLVLAPWLRPHAGFWRGCSS